jgi:hypothetical protein
MKEYIIIRSNVPSNFVPVIAAHASLIAHLKWHNDFFYQEWLKGHFKKVVCSSSEDQFWGCDSLEHSHKLTESNLDNQYVAIVLKPRLEWPEVVKNLKLWKP